MLKKVLKSALLFVALVACKAPAYAAERAVADQVAAVVGNSVVLLSDVENAVREIAAQRASQGVTSDRNPQDEALEMLMLQKLLYNQALIDSVYVNLQGIEMATESILSQEIADLGSTRAVEEHYKKPIFQIRDDIRERYTESQYAQSMRQTIESDVVVTPGEVELFYQTLDIDALPLIPEQYVFAQITKYPPSAEDARFRARQSLLEMRERIMDGTRFDVLARMYSVDGSAIRGGEMDPTRRESFVKPFGDALVKLNEGQVSGVVETEYGYHLIQLMEKLPNELYRCRHILVRPIFTDEEIADAVEILNNLRTEIMREGSTLTFAEAASLHSEDKYSRLNGGVVTNFDILEMYNAMDAKLATTRFFREELSRDNYTQLSVLKEGEISRPFQTSDTKGNVLVNMIKLVEIVPAHPANLDNDYVRIEELALEAKKEKTFSTFVEQKVDGMYVRIDDRFKDAEFENNYWVR